MGPGREFRYKRSLEAAVPLRQVVGVEGVVVAVDATGSFGLDRGSHKAAGGLWAHSEQEAGARPGGIGPGAQPGRRGRDPGTAPWKEDNRGAGVDAP